MSIKDLSAQSTVGGNDSVPIYSESLGANVRVPVSALATALASSLVSIDGTGVQRAAPSTGTEVAVAVPTEAERLVMLTPAGALATLTVRFPAAVDTSDGYRVRVFTTAGIAALTLTSTGATFLGGITTLAADTGVLYRYDGVLSAWVKLA